jgi:hypothetical protein
VYVGVFIYAWWAGEISRTREYIDYIGFVVFSSTKKPESVRASSDKLSTFGGKGF